MRPLTTALLLSFFLFVVLVSHATLIILLTQHWGLVAAAHWLVFGQDRVPLPVLAALGAVLLVAFGIFPFLWTRLLPK